MATITAQLTTVDLCESVLNWAANRLALNEIIYKQGSYSISFQTNKNVVTTATWQPASAVNWSSYTKPHLYWTERCDFMVFCEALNSGSTSSGLIVGVYTNATNYKTWHVAGNDTWDGGWRTFVLDLSNTANVYTSSGTLNLASVAYITFRHDASNSGNVRVIENTWIDAVRVGEGLTGRSTTTETWDFDDMATADMNNSNYYGVVQKIDGILFAQGKLLIGNGSNNSYFNSSNEVLVFKDRIVSSDHYEILADDGGIGAATITINNLTCICQGSSGAELDISNTSIGSASISGSVFTGMGTIDLSVCDVDATTFKDCGTIVFGDGNDALNCTFDGCDQVTQGGADMSGSEVKNYAGTADTGAVLMNETSSQHVEMDGMTFTKGTTLAHAIEFGTSVPSKVTLTDCTFIGYSGSDSQTDSTFYFQDTNGTINLELLGCTGNFTVKTAGCTVIVTQDTVTTRVTVYDADTGTGLLGARVFLEAADGTGDLPYNQSVSSVTRSVNTATLTTSTAHGLKVGDFAVVKGADQIDYNGAHEVLTVPSTTTLTYAVANTPTTPATGTITLTGGIFNDTTNEFGYVQDARELTNDQPVTGYARKSSATPYYKSGLITGTIDAENGAQLTVYLSKDE